MTPDAMNMDAGGSYAYLVRSVAIVTLLYERGILDEIFSQGRLTEEEVDQRVDILRRRFPQFAQGAQKDEESSMDEGG